MLAAAPLAPAAAGLTPCTRSAVWRLGLAWGTLGESICVQLHADFSRQRRRPLPLPPLPPPPPPPSTPLAITPSFLSPAGPQA